MSKIGPKLLLGISIYMLLSGLLLPLMYMQNLDAYVIVSLIVLFIITAAVWTFLYLRSQKLEAIKNAQSVVGNQANKEQVSTLLENNKLIEDYFKTQETKDRLNLLKMSSTKKPQA